jgi:hypothetical protein
MEEKKTKFVVWSEDFFGSSGYKILGHVNTFAEGQELLVNNWKKLNGDNHKKIEEILSHTEDEMEGRDGMILCKSTYFLEGIDRVPGYVDKDETEPKDVTLGEILKRELADVKGLKWKMQIDTKNKEEFYLQVDGCNKVPVGNKYERIVGLPTHSIDWKYRVSGTVNEYISGKAFPDVEWKTVSAEEIDRRLKDFFLSRKIYYSEEEAFSSLPNELVLEMSGSGSISPYDKHGYQIVNISAYGTAVGNGVYVHIRRCGDAI